MSTFYVNTGSDRAGIKVRPSESCTSTTGWMLYLKPDISWVFCMEFTKYCIAVRKKE